MGSSRVAMTAFIPTATDVANDGKSDRFVGLASNAELDKFFTEDRRKLLS